MPVIAIVGAGGGMGRAIAQVFGRKGFRVALLSRDPAHLEPLVAELTAAVEESCAVLARLEADYAGRGVELVRVGGAWFFRTAADLAPRLRRDVVEPRKLGRAALETLAIIAYHQPVTRTEIEQVRKEAKMQWSIPTIVVTVAIIAAVVVLEVAKVPVPPGLGQDG